jgi:hypothetical protein
MTIMRLLKCRGLYLDSTEVTPSRVLTLQCVVLVSYLYHTSIPMLVSHHVVLKYMWCAAASEACRSRWPRYHWIQSQDDGLSIGSSLGFYRCHPDQT